MKRRIFIKLIRMTALIGLVVFQAACFQMQAPVTSAKNSNSNGVNSFGNAEEITGVDCTMLTVSTYDAILSDVLGISESNLMMLDANGSETNQSYLDRFSASLGAGDIEQGAPDNYACTSLKFKIATQLYIDACTEALNTNPDFMGDLFPSGMGDYDTFYTRLLGRLPDGEEIAALDGLVSQVDPSIAPAAVCAAVASSLEALNQI